MRLWVSSDDSPTGLPQSDADLFEETLRQIIFNMLLDGRHYILPFSAQTETAVHLFPMQVYYRCLICTQKNLNFIVFLKLAESFRIILLHWLKLVHFYFPACNILFQSCMFNSMCCMPFVIICEISQWSFISWIHATELRLNIEMKRNFMCF